jgi:hypothetical protein
LGELRADAFATSAVKALMQEAVQDTFLNQHIAQAVNRAICATSFR